VNDSGMSFQDQVGTSQVKHVVNKQEKIEVNIPFLGVDAARVITWLAFCCDCSSKHFKTLAVQQGKGISRWPPKSTMICG
jgi:hypothetical protein